MKPGESFVNQPIRSLQTMLRTIAQVESGQPSVIPDGIYGTQTKEAVSAFQRRKGLPVTGVTDNATWDLIVQDFEPARIETEPAQVIQVTINPGTVYHRGQRHDNIFFAQVMLLVLSRLHTGFPEVELTGVLDMATQEALLAFQIYSGLPPTGELDKQTWKALSLQYSRAADELTNQENS